MNSEQNKPNYSRQRCLFKSLLRYGLQVQHHASSRPKNSSSSKRHGQILNIPLMHTCFNGRPRPSRHHERQVPFHRFKFSLDGIHINTVLVYPFQAPFPVLRLYSTIQMALQCRAAAFPHTIKTPSETPLTLTPLHLLRWAAGKHHYLLNRIEFHHHYLTNSQKAMAFSSPLL
jgi:hypothetical protein